MAGLLAIPLLAGPFGVLAGLYVWAARRSPAGFGARDRLVLAAAALATILAAAIGESMAPQARGPIWPYVYSALAGFAAMLAWLGSGWALRTRRSQSADRVAYSSPATGEGGNAASSIRRPWHAASARERGSRMWQWLKRWFAGGRAKEPEAQVWNFRIKGGRAEIGAVNDALERAAMAAEVPESAMRAMQVALDELLTNAITHGEVSLHDPMQVDLIIAKDALRAVVSHAGKPFDPTKTEHRPDLEGALEDRPIGGLGLHLVRELMDEFSYEFANGRNVLRVGKRF
jgi:anti-sigma regulatory factor (Ser/Thr protein kinase)